MPITTRICFVVPNHWDSVIGGAQYQVHLLIEQLRETTGILKYLVVENGKPNDPLTPYRFIQLNSTDRATTFRWQRIRNSFRLLYTLIRIHPAVIYQRVGCSYTGVCALYARIFRCRFIWHVAHDGDLTPLAGAHKSFNASYFWDRFFLLVGVKLSKRVIAQTDAQAEILKTLYGKTDVHVIRNFHPDHPHQNDEIEGYSSSPTLLWISNIRPEKNPEAFIHLASRLLVTHPNARCVMIGAPSSDPIWQKFLDKKIAASRNLTYLGKMSLSETNDYLGSSYILICTSLSEGFPNTFVQAWIRGVPVVSLTIDPDSILQRHHIGQLSGTEDEMEKQVCFLLDHPEERAKLGKNAAEYAQTNHSIRNTNALISLLLAPHHKMIS